MWFLLAVESTTDAGVDGDEDAADCLIRCFGGADSSSADDERGRTVPLVDVSSLCATRVPDEVPVIVLVAIA